MTYAILVLLVGVLVNGCVELSLRPVASFSMSPDSGPSPLVVTFDASESSPEDEIIEYLWNFGDGATDTGKIVDHLYQVDAERSFTVTLQITDQQGRTASVTDEVLVQVSSNPTTEYPIQFVLPFHYDAEGDDAANLNDEYFTLANIGDVLVDLSGWSVENDRGTAFAFPAGTTLAPGATITIYSGSGVNTAGHLYWQASEPIWDNQTDTAWLFNATHNYEHHFQIQSC